MAATAVTEPGMAKRRLCYIHYTALMVLLVMAANRRAVENVLQAAKRWTSRGDRGMLCVYLSSAKVERVV